ncbi:hypothetical protein Q3G72_000972 [Acer saccharum]|nr:hypothetical protein Q3G72_000972 [Acer saccharum]
MFYVDLIVCIICIHMITLGSPCKRHEVLVRVRVTWIAKQEDLPRVGMTRIGKQEVMARVGRTRIVMHGRLPRGMSVSDRELAIVLAVRWSSSAGRPAPLTGAKRLVARRWTCAGPHQRKATSADRPVWLRWCGAGVSACHPAPKQKCACALVLRLLSSAGPPAHRAFFWRVFKTTSLHLWPLYIC